MVKIKRFFDRFVALHCTGWQPVCLMSFIAGLFDDEAAILKESMAVAVL